MILTAKGERPTERSRLRGLTQSTALAGTDTNGVVGGGRIGRNFALICHGSQASTNVRARTPLVDRNRRKVETENDMVA